MTGDESNHAALPGLPQAEIRTNVCRSAKRHSAYTPEEYLPAHLDRSAQRRASDGHVSGPDRSPSTGSEPVTQLDRRDWAHLARVETARLKNRCVSLSGRLRCADSNVPLHQAQARTSQSVSFIEGGPMTSFLPKKAGAFTALAAGFLILATYVPSAQQPAQQPAPGAQAPAGRGGRGAVDPRVQQRTYLFTDTNEQLPYAVFVSSKVSKDK